jgi:hypothetical protein
MVVFFLIYKIFYDIIFIEDKGEFTMGGISTKPSHAIMSKIVIGDINLGWINPKSESDDYENEYCDTDDVDYSKDIDRFKSEAEIIYDSFVNQRLNNDGNFLVSVYDKNNNSQKVMNVDTGDSAIINYSASGVVSTINANSVTYYYLEDGTPNAIYYHNSHVFVQFDDLGNITYQRFNPDDGTLKPISIFDLENHNVKQFGADQGALYYNFDKAIKDPLIYEELQKYYPEDSFASIDEAMEFYERYFSLINHNGCGYAGLTNIIFKEFERKELEFEQKFGFPMYTIDKNGDVDFNYELMILKIFNYCNAGRGTIEQMEEGNDYDTFLEDYFKSGFSTALKPEDIEEFLSSYGINSNSQFDRINHLLLITDNEHANERSQSLYSEWEYLMYTGSGWSLYSLDGTLADDGDSGHYMVVTGFVGDSKYRNIIGKNIVDLKPYYDLTSTEDYIKFEDNYSFNYQGLNFSSVANFDYDMYNYFLVMGADNNTAPTYSDVDMFTLIEYADSVKPKGMTLEQYVSLHPNLKLTYSIYKKLTSEEIMIYHYLCYNEGKQAADEYLKTINKWMNYPVVSSWGRTYILQIEGENSSLLDLYRYYRINID